jgi:hypothetical protein
MSQPPKHPHYRLRAAVSVVAGAAAVAALAGCGQERPADPRAGAVVETIETFASATGPQACDLLSGAALARLYGDRRGCVVRSRAFRAGQVEVESIAIGRSGDRAIGEARSVRGRERFRVVAVLEAPPGCAEPCRRREWRVDEVVRI